MARYVTQAELLVVVVTVDWASALAAGSHQSAAVMPAPYLQASSLVSLRHFTTEQRGTTVLCVRKLDKVSSTKQHLQSSCSREDLLTITADLLYGHR